VLELVVNAFTFPVNVPVPLHCHPVRFISPLFQVSVCNNLLTQKLLVSGEDVSRRDSVVTSRGFIIPLVEVEKPADCFSW
jgi:hypothetical protein